MSRCCTSCGSPIPEGQGNSCSMCYGDPEWGNDGYYMAQLEAESQEYARRQQEEEQYFREQEERQQEE